MTVQEVLLKALSGEVHWFRAAEILGWSPRTLRRWRERYEEHGHSGLIDKRFLRPSKRRLPPGQLERLLRLYRERYTGFNVRHFHQIAKREHGVTASYSFVKQALQAAGLVKKFRARGRHRQRRDPRAVHDAMLPLLGLGPRLHSELDAAFLTGADKAVDELPSAEELKRLWNDVNGRLLAGFNGFTAAEWAQKHSAVSDEDFAANPLRNRLAILLSRTAHVAYHHGQAALAPK